MNTLWIIIAIGLLLFFIWLLMQPKQGATASNAPRESMPDGLPSGEEQDASTDAIDEVPQDNAATASNAPRPSMPDGLPSGEKRDARINAVDEVPQDNETLSAPPLSLDAEIHRLLDSGQKISAIKRVREVKHWGLKEAKDYVEALGRHETPPAPAPRITSEPTPSLRQEVRRLLAAHKKVSAVKLVRDETHWHLREAKQYVDALQDEEFQAMDRALSNALTDRALQEEIQNLLATHQKFAAIKRIREVTGWELSRVMDYVNRMQNKRQGD